MRPVINPTLLLLKPLIRRHLLIYGKHLPKCVTLELPFYPRLASSNSDSSSNFPDLANFPSDRIRNFSIIAHVDHGKSTLADRILEMTGAITKTQDNKQVLDNLQVEKERGITVKAQCASIIYNRNGQDYLLNLIDTPGHVDFSYEVARSLKACDGVVLLVDANQGVQAQTVANFYLAFVNELFIVPVLNKIDLKNADTELVTEQLMNVFEIDPEDVLKISAKVGTGVTDVLDAVVDKVPPPNGQLDAPFRGLLFDSWFDKYKGVICLILVVDGQVSVGSSITSVHNGKNFEVKTLGILTPSQIPVKTLYAGQVGYAITGMKETSDAQLGDTLYLKNTIVDPLPGFKPAKPMVFAGVYPMNQGETGELQAAIERLVLNDSSVTVQKESSTALGNGWRLGFLGLLHMDVFNQRLENEHSTEVVITTPSVPYMVELTDTKGHKHLKKKFIVSNPSMWPEKHSLLETQEPMIIGTIIVPEEFVPGVTRLCMSRRGEEQNMRSLDSNRVILQYKFPLNEVVVDFYDALKAQSSGFASFDYEDAGFEPAPLVKIDILLNGMKVDELATISHATQAQSNGKVLCQRLLEYIPMQNFTIGIQAAVEGKILARENVKALKKNVLAKCYGGDVTRKLKLLKSQKEGKKRMKMIGNIEVPRDTFIKILKK